MMTLDDNFTPKNAEVSKEYMCSCGKEYSYRQGLWKHKRLCQKSTNFDNNSQEESQSDLKCILTAHCQCDEINRNQRKLPENIEHQTILSHKYSIQCALHE